MSEAEQRDTTSDHEIQCVRHVAFQVQTLIGFPEILSKVSKQMEQRE